TDESHKIDQVANINHTLLDGFKVCQETERGNGIDHSLRRTAAEEIQQQWKSAKQEQETYHHADNDCNNLVFGNAGNTGANCEKPAGHQETADITCKNDRIVRRAKIVDCDPHRECQYQCNCSKTPRSQKF